MNEFVNALVIGLLPYFLIFFLIIIVLKVFIFIKDRIKMKINDKVVEYKIGDGICPKCGSNLIMKNGKYGKFIGCSNYPHCRYTRKI